MFRVEVSVYAGGINIFPQTFQQEVALRPLGHSTSERRREDVERYRDKVFVKLSHAMWIVNVSSPRRRCKSRIY